MTLETEPKNNINLKKIKKNRHRIVPAAYLVLVKNNKVLMLRRFNTGYHDGYYGLVAGHKESEETFEKCLIREANEEANIRLSPKNLEIIHIMSRYAIPNNFELRDRIDVFIKTTKWKGEIKNLEPNKCDNLKWFPVDKLPKNTIPFIKHALNCIRKNIFYSEFGWLKK